MRTSPVRRHVCWCQQWTYCRTCSGSMFNGIVSSSDNPDKTIVLFVLRWRFDVLKQSRFNDEHVRYSKHRSSWFVKSHLLYNVGDQVHWRSNSVSSRSMCNLAHFHLNFNLLAFNILIYIYSSTVATSYSWPVYLHFNCFMSHNEVMFWLSWKFYSTEFHQIFPKLWKGSLLPENNI